MKVLNWVHRRFLNGHSCTTFPQDNEHDVDAKVDMLDQWNDGILAIGTLAIDPLAIGTSLPMTEEVDDGLQHEVITHVIDHIVKDNHDDHKDDDHDDDDDDESSPLMNVEYFSHELEKAIGENHEITEEAENVVTENVVSIDEGKSIKKRVTLADLFLEDRDYYHSVKALKEIIDDNYVNKIGSVTNEDKKIPEKVIIKPTSRAKYGLSKAKRLLKEDLHPIKKFNQLMKKMQKKKIHPDLEKKMHQDMHMQPSCGLNKPTNHQNTVNNELASLLLIQDATV